jgi:hypothetical protein
METRLTELDGHAFAFSRFDPIDGLEYLVVANISSKPRTLNTRVEPNTTEFSALMGECPSKTATMATATVTVPAFGLTVCKGNGRAKRHIK